MPLQGAWKNFHLPTQGVALGYVVLPLRGVLLIFSCKRQN